MNTFITETIKYVGVNDKTIDLFESQYPVKNGVSYNSYLILDEKTLLMDTVDRRCSDEWLANLEAALDDKKLDYLVVSHMEPDHAGNIQLLAEKFPEMKIIGNAKTFQMYNQFFKLDISDREIIVKDGDEFSIGKHTMKFVFAPMVHWPEVMMAYELSEKILFSADGFGKFGALDCEEEWVDEARRYFINIVGKYGAQVQTVLKKAAALEIAMICPLHGPILKENLGYYLEKYNTWSSYQPEEEGILIAFASIHGNTKAAAYQFKDMLEDVGSKNVEILDLSRSDMSYAVSEAFKMSKLVLAAASYDGGVFPCMEDFLHHLKTKNYQNRKVAIIENGSWGPTAARTIRKVLDEMKNLEIVEPVVTIKSTVNKESEQKLLELVNNIK